MESVKLKRKNTKKIKNYILKLGGGQVVDEGGKRRKGKQKQAENQV